MKQKPKGEVPPKQLPSCSEPKLENMFSEPGCNIGSFPSDVYPPITDLH